MKKGIIGYVILTIAFFLLVAGITLIYTGVPNTSSKIPKEKENEESEIYAKLKKQLKIDGFTLVLVKHEENIYYFNQVDKDGKVGYEVTYDETTQKISTVEKNTISDGQVEKGHIEDNSDE